MRVTLSFVPPGGGEVDYEMGVDLPVVPREGDYIKVLHETETGTCDFIARRTWWLFKGEGIEKIVVECEFALAEGSCPSHKRACEGFKRNGLPLKELEASCY